MPTAREELKPKPVTDHLRDLRGTIDFLKQEGDIIETDVEVDPDLEITGVQKHLDGGCPILFNNVKDKPNHRAITNLFADQGIMCKMFGVNNMQEMTLAIANAIRNPLPPVIVDSKDAPSHEEVIESGEKFARATRILHRETNPLNARRLVQANGDRQVVINPPPLPLTEKTLDAIYALPYTRLPHPAYADDAPIPAWQTIAESVQIMRGCFGGCTFCSITLHQGRTIQSRSRESVLSEVKGLASRKDFKGHISDLGGPTANMYRMRCSKPEVEAKCRRLSCVSPKVCKLLDTDHAPLVDLMKSSRKVPGIKKVHIASGIRMDLARNEPEYLEELVEHHVGGHLKVAPEHVSERVLAMMKKPPQNTFEEFAERFDAASKRAGKDQFLVPYFIASHPGSGIVEMIELAQFLKSKGYRPRQVQDFIPAPMDIATCMYHTGIDPETMKYVHVSKKSTHRGLQRALLQFFKPENYDLVKQALLEVGRADLIGEGPDCLIPSKRPHVPKPSRGPGNKQDGKRGGYRWAAKRGSRES